MADKPDCYKCIHRGDVAGSAHSSCQHPEADHGNRGANLLATFASVGRCPPVIDIKAAAALNIDAHAHGFRNGWFNWPYNFDPVWLERCDGFTPKEHK